MCSTVPIYMKKIKVDVNVTIIGAGIIGSNFIKEFGRYMAYFNEEEFDIILSIIDNGILKDGDFFTHPILKQDIGWNKASTIADVVINLFPNLEKKVYSYDYKLETKEQLKYVSQKYRNKKYSTKDYTYKTIEYIIDTVGTSDTVNACKQRFSELSNVVLIIVNPKPLSGNIDISIKGNGKMIGNKLRTKSRKTEDILIPTQLKFLSAITCSNIIFSVVTNALGNKSLHMGRITYQTMKYLTTSDEKDLEEDNYIKISQADLNNVVVCIGTGGTGGAFVKEFAKTLHDKDLFSNTSLVLVDGDRVEKHNSIRQPFSNEDHLQNKATTLAASIEECMGIGVDTISVYPYYVDSVEQLSDAISLGLNPQKNNKVYLIGAVDNHRARQIMHQYFNMVDNLVYIDSANEYAHGEVVISVKERGKVISPLRSFYFPEVLTDRSPAASEQSCGVVNIAAPQHYTTNLTAGRIILTTLIKSINYGIQDTGIVYFDAFRYFSRYQPIIEGVNV